MNEKSEIRDVYDAVADPTRRKLLRLLANVEDMPLHELTVQFQMGSTAVSKRHMAWNYDATGVPRAFQGQRSDRQNGAGLRVCRDNHHSNNH